jgi:hypothetical protein
MTYTIYEIRHRDSGRSYIGCTGNTKEGRFKEHVTNRRSPAPIHVALREFGADAFDLIELERIEDRRSAFDREHALILERSVVPKGFNPVPPTRYVPVGAIASRSVTFRLQPGSALERYLDAATAKSVSAKLHELAAAHEAVMKSHSPSEPVARLVESLGPK